jgi:CDP-diacylglycerol---glycerol-3-phosphate 3-phosphatidyltransferase
VSGSPVSPAFRQRIRGLAVPMAVALGRLGLTPNGLTVIGFLGTCGAAVAAAAQQWVVAGVLVVVFGIFDLFDGALARATGRATRFGAFLDSTLDRTGENLVLAGIAYGTAAAGFVLGAGLAALAMALASVVTYARARAEAVGLHGEVGVAPRPERLVLLALGLVGGGLFGGIAAFDVQCPGGVGSSCVDPAGSSIWSNGDWILGGALALISLLSAITVAQRILHVRSQSTEG